MNKQVTEAVGDIPLVVDLDGTLIRSDTTFELCMLHIKHRWIIGLIELFFWFSASKSEAKRKLVDRYADEINVAHLPYSELNGSAAYTGARQKVLVSGSDDVLVQKIAAHVTGFAAAQGTEPGRNLLAEEKARYLEEKFPNGFDYVGDSSADIAVWKKARKAYGYNVSGKVEAKARDAGITLEVLSRRAKWIKPALKGMRLHQWVKNALIGVIPFLNLPLFEPGWVPTVGLAFLSFGMMASATYLFNDLMDIPADRAHHRKKNRPFASGALSIPQGAVLIGVLSVTSLILALLLQPIFAAMLVIYTIISLAYSFVLKRVAILDTIILAILFCWRILAGGVLLGIEANAWFMLALGFFFFALALGKRAIELYGKDRSETVIGRGYQAEDYMLVYCAGLASSFLSVIIVAIYALLSRSAVIEHDTAAILIVIVLTFWQTRFWLLVGRNQVHDDPIVFALKDKVSALTLACLGLIVLVEQYLRVTNGA